MNTGVEIPLENGAVAAIASKLGDGGQGTVYKVAIGNEDYALKWYKIDYLKSLDAKGIRGWFKQNIAANIQRGSPNNQFIWPLMLTKETAGSFGYVMKLRPSNFRDFSDIYNSCDKDGNPVVFHDLRAMANSALNIVEAFKTLHRAGYMYMDLNDGNFFIDTSTGQTLVCDNDNVTAKPLFNIGKPGYIAPELVRGAPNLYSSALTDYHSLAVVLFRLLMRHDPLMGRNYTLSVCISAEKEIELYGTKPIFIFDPDDASNRPVLNVHTNPIKLWPMYPSYVHDAFIKAFSRGMKQPAQRLTEHEWSKVMVRLRDDIVTCYADRCGKSMIINQAAAQGGIQCYACKQVYPYPPHLALNGYCLRLFPGSRLLRCHVYGDEDYKTVLGRVVFSKKAPGRWGLQNLSDGVWRIQKPSGGYETIPPSKIIPLELGVKIEFQSGATAAISK
jgi:DNA-binding helix-hairpin-helix protein with protein kinase domain